MTKPLTAAEKSAIRAHLDHGHGTRKVRITGDGEVHYRGSVDELDHGGWTFGGYAEDVLRSIRDAQ